MSAARHGHSEETSRRRPLILIATFLLLVILVIVSVATSTPAPTSLVTSPVGEVAPASSESSSFTCGGFSEAPGSAADGIVLLANSSSSTRSATASAVDDKGNKGSVTLTIAPGATTSLQPTRLVSGDGWTSVGIEINGGGVGVVEKLTGAGNGSATPCAAATSPGWNFTGGSTQVNETYDISLVNPTTTQAVVNTSFSTESGFVAPQNAQGVVVNPGSIVVLSGLALVPHVSNLGAQVRATQGTIVAFATQVSPSPAGASVTIGEPSIQRHWVLSRGVASPATQMSLVVSNPTPQAQNVTVHVRLPSGWVAPWTNVVAPYSVWNLSMVPTSKVPLTDTFSANVTASGPGVAVSMLTKVSGALHGGWGNVILSDEASMHASRWLLVGGTGSGPLGGSLTNMGSSSVTVSASLVTASGGVAVSGLTGREISPGTALLLPTSVLKALEKNSIVISSTGPLSLSEDLQGGAVPSVGNLVGVPMSTG